MELDDEQVDAFRALEEQLWVAETRGNRRWMDTILSPAFTEHGRSGRVYDRREILEADIPDHLPVVLPFPDFTARLLGSTTVLVTYTTIVNGDTANRASIWAHNGEQWMLEFHQGTPALLEVEFDAVSVMRHLSNASFGTSLRGYDIEAVDRFRQDLAARIDAGGAPTRDELAATRFELSLRGYTCAEVDTFLLRLGELVG